MKQLRDNFISGYNYYVPGMQHCSEVGFDSPHEFSIGTPSAADDDAIETGIDADGTLVTVLAADFTTSGDGVTSSGNYGRNVVVSPSGDPGATGFVIDIYGRDYLGQPMRERLTVANGQTADTVGVKAFMYVDKYVLITAATNAITATLGWGSWFGIPYRMREIIGGLEDNQPVGPGSPIDVLGSGNVTVSGANAGTINAPFDGLLIGAYAVIKTATTTNPAVMDFTLGGVGNAAGDMTIPVGAAGFVARAGGLGRESAIAVTQGQALAWTSDGGPGAGVAEVFAEFSKRTCLFQPPVDTDPQTATTDDPRGLISPFTTPDASKEFIYRGWPINALNASDNGGLHGIRHYNG